MTAHPRITPGNLVVCDCSDDTDRYIALLKLDVSSGIQRHIEGNEVDLIDVPELLPDEDRELQKAAVIVSSEDFDFDMRVIDRQDGEVVAKFFQEAFLGASIAYTPTYLTRKLYDSTIFAGRRLEKSGVLSPRELNDLTGRVAETLQHNSEVVLDTWVPQLPINEDARNQLDQLVRKRLPESSFAIDRQEADRLRQTFCDHGIKIQYSQEAIDTGAVTRTLNDDGSTTIVVTTHLSQVASPRARP